MWRIICFRANQRTFKLLMSTLLKNNTIWIKEDDEDVESMLVELKISLKYIDHKSMICAQSLIFGMMFYFIIYNKTCALRCYFILNKL